MISSSGRAVVGVLVFLALVLSGCVGDEQAGQQSEPHQSTDPASPAPSEASTNARLETGGTPDDDVVGIPLALECSDILSLDALYAYNPNVGTDPRVKPTSLGERAIAYDGVACGWSNQTSGEPLTAAIARLEGDDLAGIRASAEAVPGVDLLPNGRGTFRREGDWGIIEAFAGEYWIVLESPAFLSTADASLLLDEVQRSLD